MNKINKKLLATYLTLESKKADVYLTKIAEEIKYNIENSGDNEEILEQLDILEEFIFKVPKQAVSIVQYSIVRRLEPKIFTEMGGFKGKAHVDVVIKAISLLDHLRYIDPVAVLKIILELTKNSDKTISSKALGVVTKTAKYDFNVLTKTKIGYGIQKEVLDFMLSWPIDERLNNFDFIETAVREILGSSVEGATMSDEKTMVLHSGVVSPTDFLIQLRREGIDFVFEIYKQTTSGKEKLKLLKVLAESVRTPGHVLYGPDVLKMIGGDLSYLAKIYREIIFDSEGKMIAEPAIVSQIEKTLYWLNKSEKRASEESQKLREDILKDRFYNLYRLLVNDKYTFKEDDESWEDADKKVRDGIISATSNIGKENLDQWITDINRIADQQKITDEWHFQEFRIFLRKLSFEQPAIAEAILDDSFKRKTLLKTFISSFFDGFRDGNRLDLWDKFVSKIIHDEDFNLVAAICFSLNLGDDADLSQKIREDDLVILSEITSKSGRFSFLKGNEEKNYPLHYSLINTLLRNYHRDQGRVEGLIVQEIKENPEYLLMFFQQLPLGSWKKWLDWTKMSENTSEFFKEKLIEIPDLDWHEQGLMLNIACGDLKYILDIFKGRIEKEVGIKENSTFADRDRYDAVPFHFNPDLQTFISTHPDYIKEVSGWIDEMTDSWSLYNWNLAEFVQRIHGSFAEMIRSLIDKGDDINLLKAARLMKSIDGGDLNLCMEVVGKTDNNVIVSQIDSIIYSTGVVMGENGIAEAYEDKAKNLEVFVQNQNPRIKSFAERMKKSLMDSAEKERQRTEEEIRLRKIEFEG